MGVKCFTCGVSFKGNEHNALVYFKRLYEQYKIDRYFYRLAKNGPVFICTKADFRRILEDEIKPNFSNGAEYSHISEYNPKP